MTKNAVQKLQKIENDVKRVISIYDVANNTKVNNDEVEEEKTRNAEPIFKNGSSKLFEKSIFFNKFQNFPNQCQTSPFEIFKKPGGFFFEFAQNIAASMPDSKCVQPKKPGSAPSSSSTISTISESNHIWQSPSGFIHRSLEKDIAQFLNKSDFKRDNLNVTSENDVHMTPSKTLEAANEILANCNLKLSDENLKKNNEFDSQIKTPEAELNTTIKTPEKTSLSGKSSTAAENKILFSLKKLKKDLEIQNNFSAKNNFCSKKENAMRKEWFHSATSKFLPTEKRPEDCKLSELPSKTTMEKVEKLENQKNVSSETKKKNFQSSQEKKENDKTNKKDLTSKTSLININADEKLKSSENNGKKTQTYEDKKTKKLEHSKGTEHNKQQKTQKANDSKNEETWASELLKVTDKSNEKPQKTKASKELALDTSKLLIDEYDEEHQTKEKLVENMKTTEKEKQKCDRGVKGANESKMKQELQIEELIYANAKMIEEKMKYKSFAEENVKLKEEIDELKKQHHEELIEKDQEIDKFQKERLEEIKNNEKKRTEEIQRLTTKNIELQNQLKESQTKLKLLEVHIRRLEEEITKEREKNIRKTQRIAETNKELDYLQKNSTDLEEQVKVLRKHIERFDEIQKDLLKRTEEYESRIELHQNEIKKLQEENSNLKTDLNNEKDSLLIKNKIIEDQKDTIKQLREISEEAKALRRKNESLERIISIEREEKLELQEAVKCLKWRKEELKKKIKSLENDLLLAPQEVVKDLQKTQIVLHELESQVQKKQREWEHQLQSLVKEKEQACNVAEFAAKKLVQTTNDYQRQSEAIKKLRKLLPENISGKEKNWREFIEKASQVQAQQYVPHICPDSKITTGDRHQFIIHSGDEKKVPCYTENRQKTNLHLP